MDNEFIPFELAVKLKEKGFNEPCLLHYESTGGFYSNSIDTYDRPNQELDYSDFLKCFNEGNSIGLIDAPTISQVLKWLRKEKKIHIEIFLYNGKYGYFVNSITQICEDDLFHKCLNEDTANEEYTTNEQAEIAGISYVLDNLI